MNNFPAIINQLINCGYECEGGFLVNNVAFIALQRLVKTNSSTFDNAQS